MVDIDTAIDRLEKALGTLREARTLLNGQSNGQPQKANKLRATPVAIKRLDKELAEMKRLRAKGLSYGEIGKRVGKHLSTVWSRLHNA